MKNQRAVLLASILVIEKAGDILKNAKIRLAAEVITQKEAKKNPQ